VVAVFANQHLGKQRWSCQATGDQPLRSRCLNDRLASPASILGTRGTDHAQPRRHPIQRLADTLSDHMQCAATTRAGHVVDIESHVLPRQMIGQRPALGRPFGWLLLSRRTALLFAGKIAFNLFKSERKLIRIEALGSAAELRALQLLDDGSEALDLGVAMCKSAGDRGRDAAAVLYLGEIVEIELHVRCYSNMLIRRSSSVLVDAAFCELSRKKQTPEALWYSPVDTLEQHRELRRRQHHRAARLCRARPHELRTFDPLGEQTQPCPIPKQDLQERSILAAEDEQVARERILLQVFLDQCGEPIEPLCMSV